MDLLSFKSMKKVKLILIFFILLFSNISFARHVKGGYIQYKYNSTGAVMSTSSYTITATVFFSCTELGPRASVYFGIFDASTNTMVTSKQINTTTKTTAVKSTFNPCMANPPNICYDIYTYVYTVDIPDNTAGYIIGVQDAFRENSIVNISSPASTGISITANIPGTINGVDYHINNSPDFIFNDTAIVCFNGSFVYPFNAIDTDGDSLSYVFGDGLNAPNAGQNTSTVPPSNPPYPALTYLPGYSGKSPLGSGVTINSKTGIISGMAPAIAGEYVIAVYVKEWRKGVLIDSIKKELELYVYNCSMQAAALKPTYQNCDSYTTTFQNEVTGANITSYYWDFGVNGINADTSTAATPAYTYSDTGTYLLKLRVSNFSGCTDSTTALVKVYPGFTPAFNVTGSCFQSPVTFTDATIVKYGAANSWSWDFGEPASATNISILSTDSHKYAIAGNYNVVLNVTSSKGCSGTITKLLQINNKPDIMVPFKDTLICSIDSLPLLVQVNGGAATYNWSPANNIINGNTATPVVFPKDTTVYTVTVTQNGCVGSASIAVNVLDFITIKLQADTTICLTDSFQLHPVSDALKYLWSPAAGLSNTTVKTPFAKPLAPGTYLVIANLGKCQDRASIRIKTVPYPTSYAGADTTICYGKTVQLNGIITGASFTWLPQTNLSNANTLSPVVNVQKTTSFVLTVKDILGCPKPVADTVVVYVTPKIILFAGNDTSVVVGQPLQLNAVANFSNLNYIWAPSTWLYNASIANPVAIFGSSAQLVTYAVTAKTPYGCFSTDSISIKVFKSGADIFMPTAFTPNADWNNDIFRPVLVGISKLDFFRIYDRLGKLIFTTTQHGSGWDGTTQGEKKDPGAYVYMVQGVDYQGKVHFKKGAFILIR